MLFSSWIIISSHITSIKCHLLLPGFIHHLISVIDVGCTFVFIAFFLKCGSEDPSARIIQFCHPQIWLKVELDMDQYDLG